MKVLCLVQLPPPVHGAAVMNRYIVEQVLPNSGFEYDIVELDFSKSFKEMHEGAFKKAITAFKILIKLFFKLLLFRPDIVYFTIAPFGFALFRDLIYVVLCRVFRCKLLFHFHGTGLSERKSFFYKFAYGFLFVDDCFIVMSQTLYKDVSGYLRREKCFILPNAVESAKGDGSNNKKSDPVEILYIGNYQPAKGLLTVVDVFAKLAERHQNITLRLVGEYTYYWSDKQMAEYLAKLPETVTSRIKVHGPAYGKEKIKILENANIFFYPSRHDAFPLVILEAMSYGLPVIASRQGAIPDMVESGKSGFLFESNDCTSFEKALSKVCEDFAFRKKIGSNAKKRFETYFSLPIFNKKFIEILKTYDSNY